MSVGSDAPWDHKTHNTSSVVGYSTGYPSTGTVPSNVLARDPRVCEPMGWEVSYVYRRSKKVTVHGKLNYYPDAGCCKVCTNSLSIETVHTRPARMKIIKSLIFMHSYSALKFFFWAWPDSSQILTQNFFGLTRLESWFDSMKIVILILI